MPIDLSPLAGLGASRKRKSDGARPASGGRLSELTGFGPNPGALRARTYVPPGLKRGAPLVVVLHGCTQDAAGYDAGSGWSTLADAHGFAVLFPEQVRANNPSLCFNWFTPEDTRRGGGEAASIAAMIVAMAERHGTARAYVTGLSAGGAMASVMLATYPELFDGGAIIAGLPYAGVSGVPAAMEAMRGGRMAGETALVARVRAQSALGGPWPRVSVWHGDADATVAPGNADATVTQWLGVHGLREADGRSDVVDGAAHRTWRGADGRALVESWRVPGMGHGTPIAAADGCGVAGPYMLEAGVCSTRRVAEFWGIAAGSQAARAEPADAAARDGTARAPVSRKAARVLTPEPLAPGSSTPPQSARAKPGGVGAVIEEALRSAGLMR